MDKKTVLVTAIGTMTASTIVDELRKNGGFYIIGGDIYAQNTVATSRFVDEFHVFPPAIYDLDGYIRFVLDFCREHKVEYYFAVIDEEIVNLSNNRAEFEKIGVKLCIPNKKLVDTCHFKNDFSQWVKSEMPQIAVKTFLSADEIGEDQFPVFVKTVEGRASNGCMKIDSMAKLRELVELSEIGDSLIVQEFVEGDIATVDIIRNASTGQVFTVPRKELLRNPNGCGIAVETFHDEKLEEICRTLAEKLELNGVVNAEFFITDNGYRILEVNPRYSAGTGFSCLAGARVVENAVAIADGRPCPECNITLGRHYAKRYETYEM